MSRTILKSSVLIALAVALNVLAVPSADADADTTPPSVPTGLIASVNCDLALTLTWTASTDNVGVTGYDVFRQVSTPGNFVQVATVTTTTYTEQRVASTQYEVRARDAAGNTSALSAPAWAVPPPCPAPDTQPPTTPGTPTVTTACGSATLTWTASTDNYAVTGYEIWQAPGTSGGAFSQVATVTTTSYTVTGVAISRIQIRGTRPRRQRLFVHPAGHGRRTRMPSRHAASNDARHAHGVRPDRVPGDPLLDRVDRQRRCHRI
jgi:hypothetical protein